MKRHTLYNKVLWAVALAALLGTYSCKDFLDQEPDERVIISNADQVIKLLGTAYATGNWGWICEVSSDNVIDVNAPFKDLKGKSTVHYNLSPYGREDEEAYKFEAVKSSTGTDSPTDVWESCYHAIATANHAIYYLDNICREQYLNKDTTEKIKAAYAEAYLCRAYNHFLLVNIFSQAYKNDEDSRNDVGVPYMTDLEENLIGTYERGNVTDTYKAIEKDLEKGLEWVSNVNYQKPKWHFNINAAHAFAARFYLFKRDYAKVIEHANAVLGEDYEVLPTKLMDYSAFDSCSTSGEYALQWQTPDAANNLMLVSTYSVQFRRQIGRRFTSAGDALKAIMYHTSTDHNWTALPTAFVAGESFYDGNSDHGLISARIAEEFEYSDKVAGIGYAHIIRREFTANELLLERAEARLLCEQHDIEGCVKDLIAYEDSRMSFSENDRKYYDPKQMTREMMENWYDPTSTSRVNVLDDWTFTQHIDPTFVIPDYCYTYMNCLNDYRRYETAYTGLRFFDLKRWGQEYYHVYSLNADTIWMRHDDVRRAIELPQEVLAAGLGTSRPEPDKVTPTEYHESVPSCDRSAQSSR